MMKILTVITLAVLTIVLYLLLRKSRTKEAENGEVVWEVQARRLGTAKRNMKYLLFGEETMVSWVGLSEKQYMAGNGIFDELYIDSNGPRVKLFLNVQKEQIYLSVLKGEIVIQNQIYAADRTTRVELQDLARVELADMELLFCARYV